MNRNPSGMTLIELLVVVVVVGILTSIAVPSYRSYALRANRSDAKTALLSTAAALERCYTRFNAYNGAGCPVVLPMDEPNGHYRIEALGAISANAFTLQAVPLGSQTQDTGCANLRVNNVSQRTVTGTKPATDCWGR